MQLSTNDTASSNTTQSNNTTKIDDKQLKTKTTSDTPGPNGKGAEQGKRNYHVMGDLFVCLVVFTNQWPTKLSAIMAMEFDVLKYAVLIIIIIENKKKTIMRISVLWQFLVLCYVLTALLSFPFMSWKILCIPKQFIDISNFYIHQFIGACNGMESLLNKFIFLWSVHSWESVPVFLTACWLLHDYFSCRSTAWKHT